MKVEVTVRGVEEVKRELARLSGAVQTRLARNATMAGARIGAKYARQLVPVRTGALKRSIRATRNPARQTGRVEALVNAQSPIGGPAVFAARSR
jgi:hypothetical protein